MCILFIALEQHPKYPLIVCANRDEFHHRPTQQAHFWMPENELLAGKDLQAGGSWLGVNRLGDFAALTNFRDPQAQQDGMRSRGELVINALKHHEPMTTAWLREHSQNYNPFNLVFGNRKELYCYNSSQKALTRLTSGFHSISNGALDDVWPKMARGTIALETSITQPDEPDIQALLAIMKDETRAEESELPQTGIAIEWERLLSSIYIRHPEYGTRSTSIILQDTSGNTRFIEVRYDGKGRNLGQQEFYLRK
ncbi:NRDE family protein [Shewanella woodyi]|uniref:NRDE family protein n=1 Tax=Shewanella woodyi TaxID=60961 RepID=UPI0007F976D9|nr:NRDE family protein [Shewanella woodyi]